MLQFAVSRCNQAQPKLQLHLIALSFYFINQDLSFIKPIMSAAYYIIIYLYLYWWNIKGSVCKWKHEPWGIHYSLECFTVVYRHSDEQYSTVQYRTVQCYMYKVETVRYVCTRTVSSEGRREIRPWTNQNLFRSTGSLQNLFRIPLIWFGTPQLRSKPSTL